jgi:uncharacterized protein YjbJ (UPF0337 family)
MSNETEVRQEIEDTRERLGNTVDAIGDRVIPGRVIERRKNRMSEGVRSIRERVMGTASDTGQHVADAAHAVTDAPGALAQRSQGNPLLAGATAFGVGLLAGAIWRPTQTERELASRAADQAPQVFDEVGSVAQDVAGAVKEKAGEAVGELRSETVDAAHRVKDAATSASAGT